MGRDFKAELGEYMAYFGVIEIVGLRGYDEAIGEKFQRTFCGNFWVELS